MLKTERISLSYISENAVLVEWPEKICPHQHQQIVHFQQQVHTKLTDVIIDTVASYASLIIYYHIEKITTTQLDKELTELINCPPPISSITATEIIDIPVYYGLDSGWDLKFVAAQTSLSIEQVIELHSQTVYHAYALGFTPGFCYLASLPNCLQLPRRSSPRLSVPQGAVAIAEQQTAVYPISSPAGWHVIGQTPMTMFDTKTNDNEASFSAVISVGQQVRFTAISQEQFLDLGGFIHNENNKESAKKSAEEKTP